MDGSMTVEQSTVDPYDHLHARFVFRLPSLEEQFKWLFPADDFGRCWPLVDQFVKEYPDLFRGGQFDVEGIQLCRDGEGKFITPGCPDEETRRKISQVLEALVVRIAVDENTDVALVGSRL